MRCTDVCDTLIIRVSYGYCEKNMAQTTPFAFHLSLNMGTIYLTSHFSVDMCRLFG